MRKNAVIALVLCAMPAILGQQQNRDLRYEPEAQGRRVALVIGNDQYGRFPLKSAANDARNMAQSLKDVKFEVTTAFDTNLRSLEGSVDQFVKSLAPGDVALFYYAGHGFQIDGENYLVPVDFDAKDEADAKYVSYSASRLIDRMERTGARLKIVILDACRTNPYRVTRSLGGGLAQMNAGRGSFIAFATSPGTVAVENTQTGAGLFTQHLVKALQQPGLDLNGVFDRVRQDVDRESNGKQLPWISSSVIGEFRFREAPSTGVTQPRRRMQAYREGADDFNQGARLFNTRRFRAAVPYFQRAAEAGNGSAMAYLGSMYLFGRGVKVDTAEAVRWFRKGVDAHCVRALYGLGYMYENGIELPKDETTAMMWYRRAAEFGFPAAMRRLGKMLEDGRGARKNDALSQEWYQKANAASAQDQTGFLEPMEQ